MRQEKEYCFMSVSTTYFLGCNTNLHLKVGKTSALEEKLKSRVGGTVVEKLILELVVPN